MSIKAVENQQASIVSVSLTLMQVLSLDILCLNGEHSSCLGCATDMLFPFIQI